MNANLIASEGTARISIEGNDADLTAIRLSLQVGVAALVVVVSASLFGWAGAFVGVTFGMALLIFTDREATLILKRNQAALDHARAVAAMEIREREARLPQPPRPHRTLPPAILSPAPDGEEAGEDDEILLADDCRYVFELGKASGTFARTQFIQANRSRLTLPSQVPLTRARYDAIIARLVRDGLLVAALNGSWQISGQAGRQALPGDSDTPRLAASQTARRK